MIQFQISNIVVIFQIVRNLDITNCPCKLYNIYILRGPIYQWVDDSKVIILATRIIKLHVTILNQ